ncbi:MAG: hypothetical protein ACE5QV_00255 [Fidelibacterota bacterium]
MVKIRNKGSSKKKISLYAITLLNTWAEEGEIIYKSADDLLISRIGRWEIGLKGSLKSVNRFYAKNAEELGKKNSWKVMEINNGKMKRINFDDLEGENGRSSLYGLMKFELSIDSKEEKELRLVLTRGRDFENILKNNRERILKELKKSYSEIEFDFAKKFVEATYKKLVGKYA